MAEWSKDVTWKQNGARLTPSKKKMYKPIAAKTAHLNQVPRLRGLLHPSVRLRTAKERSHLPMMRADAASPYSPFLGLASCRFV